MPTRTLPEINLTELLEKVETLEENLIFGTPTEFVVRAFGTKFLASATKTTLVVLTMNAKGYTVARPNVSGKTVGEFSNSETKGLAGEPFNASTIAFIVPAGLEWECKLLAETAGAKPELASSYTQIGGIGSRGNPGPTGEKGEKGTTGEKGEKGEKGEQGIPGIISFKEIEEHLFGEEGLKFVVKTWKFVEGTIEKLKILSVETIKGVVTAEIKQIKGLTVLEVAGAIVGNYFQQEAEAELAAAETIAPSKGLIRFNKGGTVSFVKISGAKPGSKISLYNASAEVVKLKHNAGSEGFFFVNELEQELKPKQIAFFELVATHWRGVFAI